MNTTFSYPKWEEIPSINLYLDQVLLYVNQICPPASPDKEKGLTASMVNNYVKHGYISKPEKKTNRTIDCYYHSQVRFFYPRNCSNP